MLGGSLSLFPAARAKGLLAHLGLLAAFEAATWMRSGIFPTGTSDLVVGVQGRVPAAFGQLSASIAFFRHAFLLNDTPEPLDQRRLTLEFPNTTYVGARFGLGGRLNLGDRVVLGLELGYRWVTNPGEGDGLVRSPSTSRAPASRTRWTPPRRSAFASRGARRASASTTAGTRSGPCAARR